MKLKHLFPLFLLTTSLCYAPEEVDVDIYIIIPVPSSNPSSNLNYREVEIGSYFTPNHQSYKPDNALDFPIFSPQEAFAILNRNSMLFGKVPRGKLLNLHLTVNKQGNNKLLFSISQNEVDRFSLLPLDKQDKAIKVKLYLLDLSKPVISQSMMELEIGKKYPISKVSGKTVFLFIPNIKWVSFQFVDFNKYFFPLEVSYHSP